MRISLAFMLIYGRLGEPACPQVEVAATRPCSTSAPSWTRQEVVLHQIGDAAGPRFVSVAANVDATDERHLLGRDVGHVHVDVEDEIRHFLHHDPCGVVGAELFAVANLAAAAGADLWTSADFRRGVGRYGDERVPAGGFELRLEEGRDQGEASPLRAGRRLQILMVVQELDVEKGDALGRFGWRSRSRRSDANGKGPKGEERGKSPCGE